MTNYREILRLSSLGINNSRITASLGIEYGGRKWTVASVRLDSPDG